MNNQSNNKIKILFLAANPIDTMILYLDEELYQIESEIEMARHRDKFDLEPKLAVRVADLSRHFLKHEPDIVHFSGHGSSTSSLIFLNNQRKKQSVPPSALADLFKIFSKKVKCVVLNACWSEEQGKAIAKHVDNVIGMSREIDDEAAISFAKGFYRGLLDGRTISESFDFGIVQMGLMGVPSQEVPQLISKSEKTKKLRFVD